MSTGFYPNSYLGSLRCEIAIKLFRFLTVLQSPFSALPSFGIYKRNLLVAPIMILVRLLLPEPFWLVWQHNFYSGLGAGIVMESIRLATKSRAVLG